MGGAVALSLEKQYKQEGNNPYGIIPSKPFGAPVVSCNKSNPLLKNIIKDGIVGAGAASGVSIGASVDSAIGFADGGLLAGLSANICKKVSSDFANRITEDNNTSPGRVRYFGDPISAFDFNAATVMPSFKQRWNNSAHSYSGLFIKDVVPLHDVQHNPLTPSPEDSKAGYYRVISY